MQYVQVRFSRNVLQVTWFSVALTGSLHRRPIENKPARDTRKKSLAPITTISLLTFIYLVHV